MGKCYMTIGLPCLGKTEYAKEMLKKYPDDTIILDSDDIRKELFGSEIQDKNQEVFEEMNKRTRRALLNNKNVIYCATNLNRKRRTNFINNICKGYDCIGLLFIDTLGEILERNYIRRYKRNIPNECLENMFKSFDIPLYIEGFKAIIVKNNTPISKRIEYKNNGKFIIPKRLYDYDQNNKYHNCNLGKHIETTVEYIKRNYNNISNKELKILLNVAYYHDLGKPYTRTIDEDNNSRYFGHEKVSAYLYAMTLKNGIIYAEDDLILTLISFHMSFYSYNGNTNKLKNMLGDIPYNLLELFHKADKYRGNYERNSIWSRIKEMF